jgi:hypothetical protein
VLPNNRAICGQLLKQQKLPKNIIKPKHI